MELATRYGSGGPVIVGNYDSSGTIDIVCEPTIGESATLKSGDISVLVRIVTAVSQKYTGEIIGFENHGSYEYKGNKPGDVIAFTYGNIFSFLRTE